MIAFQKAKYGMGYFKIVIEGENIIEEILK